MKFSGRILCLAAALYLVGDAFIFDGPIHRGLHSALTPKTGHLAARVAGHPISNSQLERALNERLRLEGKSATSLAPADLKLAREAALDELIDHELLRLQIQAASPQLAVSEAAIDDRLRLLVSRFENQGELEATLKSQGIANKTDLRDRLAARIRQEEFIAQRLAPAIKVTDEEARKWFAENQSAIALPERVEARHIFIPTLDHPPEDAKQRLAEALTALTALTDKKKDFATLAKELSEDPATKDSGGALGWMTRDRLPADFAAPVFSLETNKPALIRTKLGWHLVEVTARKPAEPRAYEPAKPEIFAALETLKRRRAGEDFRKSLRNSKTAVIELFPRLVADPHQ